MQLFISDLHLDEERPAITRAFFAFLQEIATQADALYILGDLFESWIGDDEQTPLQQSVIDALKRLTEQQVRLLIMHGNRDFLIGNRLSGADFCAATGATLLPDPTRIDLYGTPALLMHGDTLCTADVAYQNFRNKMRDPTWQRIFLQRPLAERQVTARQLRELSKIKNQGKTESIMDVTPAAVIEQMQQHRVQLLIHGHTHRPQVHAIQLPAMDKTQPGIRMVLGDWICQGEQVTYWVVEASPDALPRLRQRHYPS